MQVISLLSLQGQFFFIIIYMRNYFPSRMKMKTCHVRLFHVTLLATKKYLEMNKKISQGR